MHQKSIKKIQTKTNQVKKKIEDQISTLEDILTAKDAARVFSGSKIDQSTEMELP